MNVESIRNNLITALSEHFTVQSVKCHIIDGSKLRGNFMKAKQVLGFEFIINGTGRFHVYSMQRDGEYVFTRPKEGLSDYLIPEIREKDFYFHLDGNIMNKYNLIGRFIDNWINHVACCEIKGMVADWHEESGNDLEYCIGYKITKCHKFTKTYDAIFEVLVNKGADYITYRGELFNGKLYTISDNDGNSVAIKKIFGD